jgi:hypothetical protein
VPLGIDPRRIRALHTTVDVQQQFDVSHEVGRLLGDPFPGRPGTPAVWAAASERLSWVFAPFDASSRESPPTPACQRRLRCRSRRFSRPQRLAPPPTAPGFSPGNVHGVVGLQGLSLPRIDRRLRQPSPPDVDATLAFRRSPRSPSGAWSPRKSVTADTSCDAPGLAPFLAFSSSRVSSRRRHPKVILPRSFASHLRGRSRYLRAARPSES